MPGIVLYIAITAPVYTGQEMEAEQGCTRRSAVEQVLRDSNFNVNVHLVN